MRCLGLLLAAGALLRAVDGRPAARAQCSAFGPRVECGGPVRSQAACESQGCCWSPSASSSGPGSAQPSCFTANAGASAYELLNASDAGGGLRAQLRLTHATQPELGPDVPLLSLAVDDSQPGILAVSITDAQRPRWEVPAGLFAAAEPVPPAWRGGGGSEDASASLAFRHTADPFSFAIVREGASTAADGTALFNTSGHRLVFKDLYLELSFAVSPASRFFGLGERTATGGLTLRRDGLPLVLWAADTPAAAWDQNLYGAHPLLLELRPDGSAAGLLLLSSSPAEAALTRDTLSFRLVGGALDLRFLAGPSPAAVLEQLTRIVGRPRLPPLWSLGFHQCKYGYRDLAELRAVVRNYSAAAIPLEAMWADIDYMSGWRDFTLNGSAFPLAGMQAFAAELHAAEQALVLIIDPGIKAEAGYPAYERGLAAGVFVRDVTGQPYLGQVWPGAVHYPDFLHPGAGAYWQQQLSDFHALLPFDGAWTDMNEAACFCSGEVCELPPGGIPDAGRASRRAGAHSRAADAWTDCFLRCRTVSTGANLSILSPPYALDNGNRRLPLSHRTLPTTATHFGGVSELHAHNLYGLAEARATAAAMERIRGGRRSFVLTRSTFLGSGAYAAHWTGDNAATWADLRFSVASVLRSGLAGIPFVGADICGFQRDTTEELCARWISAGAFYPFARDHSDLHNTHQELYLWPSVAAAGRAALRLRYRLLPYLATAFAEAAASGAPVARPLWFDWPGDAAAAAADQQWLLGSDVLVSPVLHQGADSVAAHFPAGRWFSLFTHAAVQGGGTRLLQAPLGQVPVHVRAGAVLPLQEPGMRTAAVRRSGFTLVLALPPLQQVGEGGVAAEGRLFFEQGDSVQVAESSLLLGMRVRCNASAGAASCRLETRTLQRPAADSGACSSVRVPPVRRLLLLGWEGGIAGAAEASALPLLGSGGKRSPDLVQLLADAAAAAASGGRQSAGAGQWERAEGGAWLLEGLALDWNCGPQQLAWRST